MSFWYNRHKDILIKNTCKVPYKPMNGKADTWLKDQRAKPAMIIIRARIIKFKAFYRFKRNKRVSRHTHIGGFS